MFDSIAGNTNAKNALKKLIAARRVPHALLFTGPDGIGKRQFAFELARALLCQTPIDGEGCGTCHTCKRVGEFVIPAADKKDDFESVFVSEHPDVMMAVPYKRSILVDAIRDLEAEANYRPYEAKSRIFIIDDADRMNDSAANALLKVLEEPPETSYIILVTSRPAGLLRTIRSRCQVVRFAPVEKNAIEEYLKAAGYAGDASLAATFANGSIGKALTLDTTQFLEWRDLMLNVVKAAAGSHNLGFLLQTSEQINDAKNKDNFETVLGVLETLIRDVWLTANDSAELCVNNDIASRIRSLADDVKPHVAAKWLTDIEELRQSFAINVNRKIATDALFVKMAA